MAAFCEFTVDTPVLLGSIACGPWLLAPICAAICHEAALAKVGWVATSGTLNAYRFGDAEYLHESGYLAGYYAADITSQPLHLCRRYPLPSTSNEQDYEHERENEKGNESKQK